MAWSKLKFTSGRFGIAKGLVLAVLHAGHVRDVRRLDLAGADHCQSARRHQWLETLKFGG